MSLIGTSGVSCTAGVFSVCVMSGLLHKKAPGVIRPGTNVSRRSLGQLHRWTHARFHPASSPLNGEATHLCNEPNSEAPFTQFGLPTLHRLSARCYPPRVTPLHQRWKIYHLVPRYYSKDDALLQLDIYRTSTEALFLVQ